MRISTGQVYQNSLNALLEQQSRLIQTQQQIASGKRILGPSDDPAGSARLVGFNQSLQLTQQYQDNLTSARSQLNQTESTLSSINNVLDRVRELALQANNATISASERRMIAVEMNSKLDELLDLANTRNGNGEYMFAGYQVMTRPFSNDPAQGTVYHGDGGQRFAQIGASRQVAVGFSGTEVFRRIPTGNGTFEVARGDANTGTGIIDIGGLTDPTAWQPDHYTIRFTDPGNFVIENGAGNVIGDGVFAPGTQISFLGVSVRIDGQPAAGDTFTVSSSVSQDLFRTIDDLADLLGAEDGMVSPAMLANATNRFLGNIDMAMENIRALRAETGARLRTLDGQEEINAEVILRLREAKSGIEDLDYASAITQLSRQLVGLDAAQKSFLQIQGLSLFNYL